MDRFRKALEKSEAQNSSRVRQPYAPSASVRPMPEARPSTPPTHDPGIVYSQTRVAALSDARARKSRIIAATDDDRAAAFRVLRTQLLRSCRTHGWRTIGITSTHRGAGKTFSATNLAVAIAQEPNQTVLLMDLDLRLPQVATAFGISSNAGIVECIKGEKTIAEVLFNPGVERLVVLPGSASEPHSSELLASRSVQNLMRELVERYDSRMILCDLPPLAAGDDVLVCLPFLDAVVLVIESGRTSNADMEYAAELLDGIPVAAVVLNKVREGDKVEHYHDYHYH